MSCVLVVDDEDMTRATFGMALRHHRWKVWEARNVEQAKELIEAFTFSAILCDVLLPDGDGEEVLEAAHRKDPQTPVIMMTGLPTEKSRARSEHLQACAYLKKPVAIQEVVALVGQVVQPGKAPTSGEGRELAKSRSRGLLADVLVPDSDGLHQVYPVPFTLEERELLIGMVMHQLIQLEDYHTPHAVEGKRLLGGILDKLKRFR
jgi:DNA-binding NtrC family response regulator